ncbi:hypothetical protein PC128_g4444 [Phytophthora cactorum]|nr:hypothetical protein PC120_g2619 [Phytophthora cactorum]KAG3090287.1 hypothetical protein PC121_g4079 [Phytophthora cactorum]KAG3200615.1 hypothetical protein PC128_g4444 [Phytophthora cactorum]KAG4062104.1 hypothetical protein PC123_g3026 [Phytophthora cactorum]
MISDGTNNFRAWRARVENELMRHGLLEYVLVQGYNGSQSFNYNGQLVEAKYPDGLRQFYTVKEAAEAMHIVQCSLHEDIVAAVLNKNVFGVWSTLRALYESGKDSTIAEKYRVLDHMWYGDKEGEPMDEFITRWGMVVREFMDVTGVKLTDSYLSAMFEHALPRKWRSTVTSWRGSRPFIPVTELKEKAIAEEKLRCNSSDPAKKSVPANARNKSLSSQPRENTTSKSFRDLSSARTVREEFCFYCFKGNHTFPQCKYLRNDINTGNTHNNRSQFSCRATEKRTSTMVQELEAYVTEKKPPTAHRPSVPREGTKRKREIDLTQDECPVTYCSKSQPLPARTVPQRSRSVHTSTSGRPSRGARSRSVYHDGRSARSPSSFRGNPNFYFFPRKQRRAPSFERRLGASP